MCYQETNRLVVQLFPRAADDVKLSLILECLPRLSVKRILCSMSDSEKEVQRVIDSAANRLIGEVVQSRRRPLLGPSPG